MLAVTSAFLGVVRFGRDMLEARPPWTGGQDDAALHAMGSPVSPQAFLEPTSGVAPNGLPIFSWDQAAAQITRDSDGWGGANGVSAVVTYAFRSTAPSNMPPDISGFQRFNAAQIAAAEEALRLWSEVANITFQRVGAGTTGEAAYSNNATILFSDYTTGADGAAAFAYYPGSRSVGSDDGDVWINSSLDYNAAPVFGDYGPHALAHEIGHAIGLSHPGDYDALDGTDPTYDVSAVYWQDARMFTIMSYFGSTNTGGQLGAYSSGPQLHDIAAAQLLYGANMTTRTGDSVYGFNSNTGHEHFTITSASQPAVFAIWDAGGNDTLDLSGYSTNSEIDLREEAFSSAGPGNPGLDAIGNISIARGAVIENAIGGSGADLIIGNAVANSLTGNGGADTIEGGRGIDTSNYTVASTAASWTRHADGTWTVSAGANGADTVNSIEFLHFTDRNVHLDRAFQTFSGDGTSDVLFRNTGGAIVSWNVTGATVASTANLGAAAVSLWTALGTGDFDGDGRDDVMWQRSDGLVYGWRMNTTIASTGAIAGVGAEWHFLSSGDFNGDGLDDAAWQRNDGVVYTWDMSSVTTIASASVVTGLSNEWSLQGVGDFNGDGKDDFLWRSTSGETVIWQMNDRAIVASGDLSIQVGNDWHVMGVGDTNNDGRDDIIWQNDNGLIATWAMNGQTVAAAGFIGSVGSDWHIAQVGDYNGDGRDDLLFINDNGIVADWMLNGSTITQTAILGGVGVEWGII